MLCYRLKSLVVIQGGRAVLSLEYTLGGKCAIQTNLTFRPAWLANVIILWLAFWLRLTDLYRLPIYGDEADHVRWAQQFSVGDYSFPLFMDGKFLLGVLVAQFHPLGPSPLWLARAVVGVFSMLNVTAGIAIGKQLGSSQVGLLAGLFYAILPQAVYYERQMLADPLMAAFGSLALVSACQLERKSQGWYVAVSAIALAAAFLFKVFGALYAVGPGLACLVLAPAAKAPLRNVARQLLAIALAATLVGLFAFAFRSRLGRNDGRLVTGQIGTTVQCPPLLCLGDLVKQINNLDHSQRDLTETFQKYFGWPIVGLASCAWPLASRDQRRRALWLLLILLAMLAILVATSDGVPPRYLFFINTPLVGLASFAVLKLTQRFGGRPARLVGLLLLIMALYPMRNTVRLIVAPQQAAMPDPDAQGFGTGYYRTGFRETAHYIIAHQVDLSSPPVILFNVKGINSLAAYLDRSRIEIRFTGDAPAADIARWLLAGRTVYIFDLVDIGAMPGAFPPGWTQVEVARYNHTVQKQIVLSRLISADAAVRQEIFRSLFVLPTEIKADYTALVDSLPSAEPMALLVYPPNHAQTLAPLVAANRANVTVIPIGDSWPLAETRVAEELARAAAQHTNVYASLAQETRGDPHRWIETWLNSHLYQFDEDWFGTARLLRYAPGGGTAQTILAGARFGDSIQLETVEILDTVASPGSAIRFRLSWSALSPISQQLKTFTHLFVGETILAQHDGQPVNELRPTTTWRPGETISDQFAMLLPMDAGPGVYHLRIGLYDITSQARLPMLRSDGTTGEFFIGGEVTIR